MYHDEYAAKEQAVAQAQQAYTGGLGTLGQTSTQPTLDSLRATANDITATLQEARGKLGSRVDNLIGSSPSNMLAGLEAAPPSENSLYQTLREIEQISRLILNEVNRL